MTRNQDTENRKQDTGYGPAPFCSLFSKKCGFTLLETVVALGVIMAAIIGPYTLATRGIVNANTAKSRLTALHLSQEGIELVRYIRDNNILAGLPWDGEEGVENGNEIRDGVWQIDVLSGTLRVFNGSPLLYDPGTGLYNYATGNASPFVRSISIEKPPLTPTPGIPGADQIRIKSTVVWTEGVSERSAALEEIIYNWQ